MEDMTLVARMKITPALIRWIKHLHKYVSFRVPYFQIDWDGETLTGWGCYEGYQLLKDVYTPESDCFEAFQESFKLRIGKLKVYPTSKDSTLLLYKTKTGSAVGYDESVLMAYPNTDEKKDLGSYMEKLFMFEDHRVTLSADNFKLACDVVTDIAKSFKVGRVNAFLGRSNDPAVFRSWSHTESAEVILMPIRSDPDLLPPEIYHSPEETNQGVDE